MWNNSLFLFISTKQERYTGRFGAKNGSSSRTLSAHVEMQIPEMFVALVGVFNNKHGTHRMAYRHALAGSWR